MEVNAQGNYCWMLYYKKHPAVCNYDDNDDDNSDGDNNGDSKNS